MKRGQELKAGTLKQELKQRSCRNTRLLGCSPWLTLLDFFHHPGAAV